LQTGKIFISTNISCCECNNDSTLYY